MSDLDAIDMALQLTRQPGEQRKMAARALPKNMFELLKVASGDSESLSKLSESKGIASAVLLDASRFAMQKIILESGSDDYRVLGLTRNANATELRDHKRLLLKWLHPDRNHNSWESKLFLRVQQAVERLEAGDVATSLAQQTPVSKRSRVRSVKREKARPIASFRPQASRRQVLLRNVGIPALTIATAAASIYIASLYGPSGAATKASILSLFQWQKT